MIFVPIAAKFLHKINENVVLTFFEHEWNLHFALPFSWKTFYCSAIAFSIADLIYYLVCPKIIKENVDYKSFNDKGKGIPQIVDYFSDVLYAQIKHLQFSSIKRDVDDFVDLVSSTPRNDSDDLSSIMINPNTGDSVDSFNNSKRNIDTPEEYICSNLPPLLSDFKQSSAQNAFWFVYDIAKEMNKNYRFAASLFYLIGFLAIFFIIAKNTYYVFFKI